MDQTRRRLLQSVGIAAVGGLAGCSLGSGNVPDGDIEVGSNYYDPGEYTAEVGETVTWAFADPGHNVSAVPDHDDQVSIPEGAEPFASYDGDNSGSTVDQGETYEYTFETPGEYTYVCIPHAALGMVGTVVVEESGGTDS